METTLLIDPSAHNIGIGLRTDSGSTIYNFGGGAFLCYDGSTYSGDSPQKGDVIGIRIVQDVFITDSDKKYHHAIWSKNGIQLGYPFILEGKGPISAVFVHDNDAEIPIEDFIDINFGEHPFHFQTGKLVIAKDKLWNH